MTNDVGASSRREGETGEFLLEDWGGDVGRERCHFLSRMFGRESFASTPGVEYGIDRRLKVEPGRQIESRSSLRMGPRHLDQARRASIFISGKSFGESPKVFDGLIPGSYTFELRKEDLIPFGSRRRSWGNRDEPSREGACKHPIPGGWSASGGEIGRGGTLKQKMRSKTP